MGKECEAFMPYLDVPLSQVLHMFTNLEALNTLSFWVFMELHYIDMVD